MMLYPSFVNHILMKIGNKKELKSIAEENSGSFR